MTGETTLSSQTGAAERSLRTVHLLLGVQSIVVILVSINRLSTLTLGYVALASRYVPSTADTDIEPESPAFGRGRATRLT